VVVPWPRNGRPGARLADHARGVSTQNWSPCPSFPIRHGALRALLVSEGALYFWPPSCASLWTGAWTERQPHHLKIGCRFFKGQRSARWIGSWPVLTGHKRQEPTWIGMDPTGTQQQLPPLLNLTAHEDSKTVTAMGAFSKCRKTMAAEEARPLSSPLAIGIQCYWFPASISVLSMPSKAPRYRIIRLMSRSGQLKHQRQESLCTKDT